MAPKKTESQSDQTASTFQINAVPYGSKALFGLTANYNRKDFNNAWSLISLSSNILAEYAQAFYKFGNYNYYVVSTVINELFENAFKYSVGGQPFSMEVAYYSDHVEITSHTTCTQKYGDMFVSLLTDLEKVSDDQAQIQAMYYGQIQDIACENATHGLGILMLLADYKVSMEASVQPKTKTQSSVSVSVSVPIKKK